MREIKFRGKTKDGEWVKGYFIKDTEFYGKPNHHSYIVDHKDPSGCFGSDIYKEVIPETIGQYTGLKDKNGVDIYEGDIIEYYDTKNLVCYAEEKGAFVLRNTGGFQRNFMFALHKYAINVIGNIHDTPELLK